MKTKSYFLLIISILISSISFSQTSVKKVISPIAIDGQLDESFWDLSLQLTPNSSSDNTANFGILWDNNYLYIGIIVTDDIICNNKRQGFYDDGVEIFIDGDNSKSTTFDQYDRLFVKPANSYWIQEMDERYSGVIHKYVRTSNGYTMEFAIPWSNFNISPSVNKNIGLNIIVNDDDNSTSVNKPVSLLWVNNSSYFSNSSTWGTITLSNEEVSYSGKHISLLTHNGGDFIIDGKSEKISWISNGVSNIDIEYSTDNGSNWDMLATNLISETNYYIWEVSATPSDQCLIRISESENASLNDISESLFTISSPLTAVEPLIPNTWKNYQWPYNAYFPEDENGINGRVGSACGHASLARIINYWEYPITGNDELTFTDNAGHQWSADFSATTYDYDNMPSYLALNSTEQEYKDVATLTYHAATSMHDIYGSGGDLNKMAYAMKHYFKYKQSTPAIRSDYTRAEWIKLLMNELDNGRVILIDGMTTAVLGDWHNNSWIAGHWFHIDGYNEDGLFHGILGFSDEDGYFDINNMFNYSLNNGVLIGLEPDLNGKVISLQNLNNGENLPQNKPVEIKWSSENIDNIRIEFTIDNGKNWEVIHDSFVASLGKVTWTTPNISTEECKVKITDVTDINVYDKSDLELSIKSYELLLTSLNGGEYIISGELTKISWSSTPVENIKIEFSDNNGSSWQEIIANAPTITGNYDWIVADVKSRLCKIRIIDVTNSSIFDESDNPFEIGIANNAGGPYITDENTVLLLHFDENLIEETHNYPVTNHGITKTFISNPIASLNNAIIFDNSSQSNDSYITIPNTSELNLTGNWTIEFWMYINSWNDDFNKWPVPILLPTTGFDSNYFLEVPSTEGRLKYGFKSNNGGTTIYTSQNSIATKVWYHVALINDYDNHEIKIVLRDSDFKTKEEISLSYTAGTQISTGTADLRIGAGLFGDNHLNGYIDELRISNIVRAFSNTMDNKNLDAMNSYSIYPNPANSSIYIDVPEDTNLIISTITGQAVLEKMNFKGGDINTSKLNKGIYIVTFESSNGVFNKKLIIE